MNNEIPKRLDKKISTKLNNKIKKLDENNKKMIDLGTLKVYTIVWNLILKTIPNKFVMYPEEEITLQLSNCDLCDLYTGYKTRTDQYIEVNQKKYIKFDANKLNQMFINDGLNCVACDKGLKITYNSDILRTINKNNKTKQKGRK